MIILKIILIALLSLLLLCFILLLLPLTVAISFKNTLCYKAYFCGIKLFDSAKEKSEKKKKAKDTSAPTPQKASFVKELYEKRGIKGTVEYFSHLAAIILKRVAFLLKHIKFRKLRFSLWVASGDAAQTAIDYGAVCAVVYPLFSALTTVSDCKIKSINIFAQFNSEKSKVNFSFIVRSRPLFLLIAALVGFWEYKKYKGVNLQ